MSTPEQLDDDLAALRDALVRMALSRTTPDSGTWVVIGTLNIRGTVAVPLMGGTTRYTMRRFDSAEEAMANTAEFPAGKMGGGYVLNITTGETVPFAPFSQHKAV